MKKIHLVIVLVFTISSLCMGCIDDSHSSKKKFLVSCGNSDTLPHSVHLVITTGIGTELFNSTINIEPENTISVYKNYNLKDEEYNVKVTVDNNWADSINHSPSSHSWVSLHLGHGAYELYIKYKD